MAQMPPNIQVYSTAQMEQMTEALRSGLHATADYLANQAVAMHPLIVAKLRKEGLDGPGRFRWSSTTAEQAASAITRQAQRSAEHMEAAAKFVTAMNRAWHKHYKGPMEAARAQLKAGSGSRMMGD